ncbi:oxidoreductase [Ochrobactrum sp. MYb379]|uniref:oxidoreductase n=1 Tax=Ochrobactrum sp. MYb379 TaxID=2745275 RepID=UPI00309F4C4C
MPLFNDTEETFAVFVKELGARGIAYVHVMDHTESSVNAPEPSPLANRIEIILRNYRSLLPKETVLMVAGAMTRERADRLLAEGTVDIIVFGRWFISNPDLVERLRNHWPLNEPKPEMFYPKPRTSTDKLGEGYTDYPPFIPQSDMRST